MQWHARWNVEDSDSPILRNIAGALLMTSGVTLFLAATRAAWGIVRGGDVSLETTYYYLLVPVTLPVTIVFVYLNWLALSIFKTA